MIVGPNEVLALVLVLSLTAYALLGGADYGGGLWDLLASGPTADQQRRTIAQAIGPVWEANHVWLIVAIVIVFTGFPRAYAALSTYLHVPLVIVLLGITLRGSAFVFRSYGPKDPGYTRFWSLAFAVTSIVTPVFLGIVVGAITEGRIPESPQGTFAAVYIRPWVTPFAAAVGAFTLALFGYLAAVYLTLEAHEPAARAAFRRRALTSWAAVFALAIVVFLLAVFDLRSALVLSPWAVPLHAATGGCAAIALACLWLERYEVARAAAAGQVMFILWGWALAQYPHAIRPHLTLADASGPATVQVLLLQVLGAGAVVLLPSLVYLFRIFGPRGDQARGRREGRRETT